MDQPGLVEWFAQTIDCDDAEAMATFYVGALGGRVTRRHEDGDTSVEAGGLALNFRVVPGYRRPSWPSSEVPMQSHFELVVGDLDAAQAALVVLGATEAEQPEPLDPHLTVMLDPAGHPLCLIRAAAATRF
jgi:catechol 2,3-dioxygenase-like lactoylglutathione lyase family enzyme